MNIALRNIQDLKQLPQWVVWIARKKPNGRIDKVPYNPKTGKGAKSNDPSTWATYQLAQSALRNEPQKYNGLGFMFFPQSGIMGIDLDHCIDEHGTIDQWAQNIISGLNSYCEISPYGEGIHIFVRGTLPNHAGRRRVLPGKRHPEAAIEMYDSGRFFTVTGKHLDGTPLTIGKEQQKLEKLYAWLEQISQRQSAKKPSINHPIPISSPLSDNDLLEKAMSASNGQKFTALWRGNTSDYQGDESSADLALCTMLAFWTGKDAARIDRLFRQSGLMRKKWDRKARTGETYGEGTITRAIAQSRDIYNPLEEPGRLNQQITSLLSSLGKHQSKLPTGEQEARPTLITQKASELVKKEFPAIRWAVPDMIPEGVTLMAGKPKIGKSWAALNIGLGVASGGCVFGKITVEAGRVLYLALEDHERRLQDRLIQMMEATGTTTIPEQFDLCMACPRFDAGGLELLETWIQDHPDARLILIDTWAKISPRPRGRARSLYDEEHDAMAPLQKLAATHSIAIVALHHLRKTGSDSDVLDEISGSTGLMGAVDGFLVFKKDRGQFDAVLHVIGRDIPEEQKLALSFDQTTALWTIQGDAEAFAKTKERQEILDLLKEFPKGLGARAIAETLNKNRHTTRNLLSRMQDAGQIEHKGKVYLWKQKKQEGSENHSQKEEKRNHRSQRSERSHSNKVVSSSESISPSLDYGSGSNDSIPDYGENSAHQPVKPAQMSHDYGDYGDYAEERQATSSLPEQSNETSDNEKSVSSVVTPVVLSHTTVVTPSKCCTEYEEHKAVDHQPGTALTTDSRGNPWCEKCEKQRELMDQGTLTGYPRLVLSYKGRHLLLTEGEEEWFKFARRAGYPLVTEGLEAIRKFHTPDIEE